MEGKQISQRDPEAQRASQLDELLECERELARLLTAARSEAREIVERVRAEAIEAAAEVEASLASEAAGERQRAREESRSRIESVSAEARNHASRYDDLSDADVERLADFVFRRLLGAGGDT